ncbi:MAG: hypothetical protein IPK64_14220 [bacterium]|nr:hypothetical protein [bacterium]
MKSRRGYGVQRQGTTRLVVEVGREARGRWTVGRFERVDDSQDPSPALARAMSRDPGGIAWLLDDTEARTSVLGLPPLKGRALERAVAGLIARGEGGTPDSWAIGCQLLGPRPGGQAGGDARLHDVFVMYATRTIVDAQIAAATAWGTPPGIMLPAHLALDLLYRRHGPEHGEHEAWNLVFIGREASYLCISTREHLLLTRRLPQDLSHGADPAEYLGRLATEVERSIFFARQTERSPHVERIIVCGDHAIAPRLVERLQQQGLAPSLHWELESLFVWGANAPAPDDLPVAAAALLACEGVPLNLLARRSGHALSAASRRRALVGAGAVGLAAVPLLLVGGLMTARIQGQYLDKARDRLAEAQARAGQAEAAYRAQRVLMAREERIVDYTAARPDLESVLRRVAILAPSSVVFKSLRMQEPETGQLRLQIEGESVAGTGTAAQSGFVEFLEALRASDFATLRGEPRTMHIKPVDNQHGSERTVFSLELGLKPAVAAQEG